MRGVLVLSGLVLALSVAGPANTVRAETLEAALARAYSGNPTLNAQRASVRVTDENVPQALSGYRPRIFGSADAGVTRSVSRVGGQSIGRTNYPRGIGLSVEQTLFDGLRTPNAVRGAEAGVLAARAALANEEQNVLFDAAEAYMNVLRDLAIFNLRNNNVGLIDEELRATRARFDVGELTRTDVSQAQSRLSGSRSLMIAAEAQLKASRAIYRQRIGVEPSALRPGRPLDGLLPASLDAALELGTTRHPAIQSALFNVDVATMQVKVVEGELYPTVTVEGSTGVDWGGGGGGGLGGGTGRTTSAAVVGRLTVPIYQAGQVSSRVRQAKETLGQVRIEADIIRDQVRAAVVSAWGALEGARAQIVAAQAQVEAAQIALEGVREEARVGQRTTLDALNAQQELLDARVTLITAQRDRVVATYALLQAVGSLSAERLGLAVAAYDPGIHYNQVRDRWGGLRTPDGR